MLINQTQPLTVTELRTYHGMVALLLYSLLIARPIESERVTVQTWTIVMLYCCFRHRTLTQMLLLCFSFSV